VTRFERWSLKAANAWADLRDWWDEKLLYWGVK